MPVWFGQKIQTLSWSLMMVADYYLGLISGTSADGVDAAIIDENNYPVENFYQPYDQKLRDKIRHFAAGQTMNFDDFAALDIALADDFSTAAKMVIQHSGLDFQNIRAIGSHGQTIFHAGGHYSLQLANGGMIAEQTKIPVVCDFRTNDIAAGGQGAPLATIYHRFLLGEKSGIIVNLGGIANLTEIRAGKIIAYDTGPANTLLDFWIGKHKGENFDKDGAFAKSGTLDQKLLARFLADDYFQKPPPKSTGVEYFNEAWLDKNLHGREKPADVQRTLLELTARSISQNIPPGLDVYLCGGGAHNLFLRERLSALNPENIIKTSAELGVDVDFVEAAAFAFLAKKTLAGAAGNIPEATGATGVRILGAIYEPFKN